MNICKFINIKSFPFTVDTNKFINVDKIKTKIFIYFKRRKPEELNIIETFFTK
jgi:hypothetical protein